MIGFTLSPQGLKILLDVLEIAPLGEHPALVNGLIDKLSTFKDKGVAVVDPEDYEEMLEDQIFLQCLQAAGVDNWDGYSDAQEMMEEDFE
ncbi:hypothetical protein APT65_00074 [Trabzonvirus APT65]|uniref:Uncharacterized protein n=1 Tax=Aeromonas phage APT65 TaxID=2982914 RepID=A0A9E8JZP3_9CAUD|nr:hypothetical protein APT65_00074 [Aeromonas phage APT65]